MPAAKRSRKEAGISSGDAQKIAAAINMKFNKRFPYADYGRMAPKRGSELTQSMFGSSFKDADEAQRSLRRQYGYTGRGKYWGKALGGALGSIGGMMLGGPKGAAIGSKLGSHYGDKWTGRGIYTGRGMYSGPTNSNELIAGSTNSSPKFASVGDESGSLMVSHREYIGDIFAPPAATVSDFTVQSFPLNPGLEQTFPWLSQIAQNYEEYEMVQLVFEFVSTVQDINSNNGQVGTILTATQYNPAERDFTDKPAMAAYAHSISGKSVDNQNHGVECDPAKLSGSEGKYIRANPVMTGEDLKTYDHGRFQLATHNIPAAMAAGTLGELYVSYTIKLRKPKFFTGRGLGLSRWLAVADSSMGGPISLDRPFGNTGSQFFAKQNNLPVLLDTSVLDQTKLTFPAYYGGRLRLTFIVEGSGLGGTISQDITFSGNVSRVSDLYAGGSETGDSPASEVQVESVTRRLIICSVNVAPVTNATDNSFTLITNFTVGTINQSSIEVTEFNSFNSAGAPQLVNEAGTAVVL